MKLPGHPEGFQLDLHANILLVNVPDKSMIGVIDVNQFALIRQWPQNSASANFPLAIDGPGHLVFTGFRHPAKLVVLDELTGKEISRLNITGDVDDIFFDSEKRRIYVSGGAGFINIFQEDDQKIGNK